MRPNSPWIRVVCRTALASLCLAGCGSSPPPAMQKPPSTASQTVSVGSSAAAVTLPPVGDLTVKLTLPPGTPVGASLKATVSTTVPAGITPPAAARFGDRAALGTGTTAPTPIVFLQLTNNTGQTVVLSAYPGFSVTTQATAGFPSGTYEVEVQDAASAANGWQIVGTAVLSSSTLVFTGPQSGFTLPAGDTATLALVAGPGSISGTITLSPATTANSPYVLAPGGNVVMTAVENGYSGAFSATSGNTNVATVARGSAAGTFVVTGVGRGTTQIAVTSNAANGGAVFYVSVSAPSSNTFTVSLPAQQGQAVFFGAIAGTTVTAGTVTFPVAPSGNPYPTGTVVTVALSATVPAGFGFATPSGQLFGVTFTSNQTLTPAVLPALPAMTFTGPAGSLTSYVNGEVLLPLAPFASACSIGFTNSTWTVAPQAGPQGLTAGTPSGYDFFFGNVICLP